MKKLPRNSQDNTNLPKPAKIAYDNYRDMLTFRMKPVSDHFIDKLAQELVDWARNNEDALKLTQFFVQKGIDISNLYRWEERNETLKTAHEFALMCIGARREIGAIKKKYDAGIIASTMAHYDPSWKDLEEWRAMLRRKELEQNQTKFVVIERFPSIDSVPERLLETKGVAEPAKHLQPQVTRETKH